MIELIKSDMHNISYEYKKTKSFMLQELQKFQCNNNIYS